MQRAREHSFDLEDVGDIIELATRLDGLDSTPETGFSEADVVRLAGELGISPDAVSSAIRQHRRDHKVRSARSRLGRISRIAVQIHVLVYVVFIAGMGLIDLAMGDGFGFVQFPAIVWGMLLACHLGIHALVRRSPRRTG